MEAKSLKIGSSELELLRYFAHGSGITIGEAAEHFHRERGWVRTTVQKTADRLVQKGLLRREDVGGVFRYRATMSAAKLESGLVDQFVRQSLGGSLRPFVAYLDGNATISDKELEELRALVDRLDKDRGQK